MSQSVLYRPLDNAFGAFRLADHDISSGSLLGSPAIQLRLKATGAIGEVFCVAAGKALLRAFVLKHWDAATSTKLERLSGHFWLHPERQDHTYLLDNGVRVTESVFVSALPQSTAHYIVEFSNESSGEQKITTLAFCELASGIDDGLNVRYDPELRGLAASSVDDPKAARIVGANREPDEYEVSLDHALAVEPRYPRRLTGETQAPKGLAVGILRYETQLAPGERSTLAFRLAVSASGEARALEDYRGDANIVAALERTQARFRESLACSHVTTPSLQINRGVLWAKANMERVFLETPIGTGFTNDPINSNHCVGRDTAWFCAGADFFNPAFSSGCLPHFFRKQNGAGLIPEYVSLLDDSSEDFGLNINDNTPLIVWSTWHHYQMTGDRRFLDRVYDGALKACRYILRQRNEQGLVWCTSHEKGSKGIISWRNVIQGYRLSGAGTEVNSECYGAFRAMAALAAERGEDAVRREFEDAAAALKGAIDAHLFNPENGLYYLNVDVDGTPRSDVTADLVFPVIFNVAQRETAERIVRRLSEGDFWTAGGMRTIPHDAIDYTPDKASGCLGGVWNGMTFWYAKAASAYLPDFAAQSLAVAFENYGRDPRRNNTVPGQFSEWLHGETLVNSGMDLSPWFPPRYLWAAIEGVLGLDLSGGKPRIAPHLPAGWRWAGVRNVPYRGKSLTWFCARMPEMHVWASRDADCSDLFDAFDEDLSDRICCSNTETSAFALRRGSRIVVLAGNVSDRTATTTLQFRDTAKPARGKRFDSLSLRWSEVGDDLSLLLEPQGYALYEFETG